LKADYEIKAAQQSSIFFNLCKSDHADEQCHGKHGSFAITKKSNKCYNLGGEGQHPEFSLLDENEPAKGFKAIINGGDRTAICPSNSQRNIEIEMHCDESKKTFDFVCQPDTCEDPRCHFKVAVYTSLACPPKDDSWGWTFIILFGVSVVLYLGVGIGWNIKQHGLRGAEAIPHLDFWKELPGLVKEGCEVTKNWATSTFERVRGAEPSL